MRNIIIIHGKKGAGKDAVADYIHTTCGYCKTSFADPLKRTCVDILNALANVCPIVTLASFNNQSLKEASIGIGPYGRDSPGMYTSVVYDDDSILRSYKSGVVEMTPRRVMQFIGTDVLRKHFGPNVHVNSMIDTIRANPDTDYVIPDARFMNELTTLIQTFGQTHNITTIHLSRPVSPVNQFSIYDGDSDTHVSEQPLEFIFDHEICNDGTLDELTVKIESVISRD